jgi:hypothetical protein
MLVENEQLAEDRYWGGKQGIRRNNKNVQEGDELFIYTPDQDLGIIGYAKIIEIDKRPNGCWLVPAFNFEKCRMLLLHTPIRAPVVRAWKVNQKKVNLQRNVINLAPLEKQLRALLPKGFSDPLPINVEDQELTDEEIDQALRDSRLRMGIVPTDSQQAQTRQRRGQGRIHKLTVEQYEGRCAVCDVTDHALLVASHVVGWAESPEDRGILSNIICLCRIHDALFETGYWSLGNNLELLRKQTVTSYTIRQLLDGMTSFRKPLEFAPASRIAKRHREKAGFTV